MYGCNGQQQCSSRDRRLQAVCGISQGSFFVVPAQFFNVGPGPIPLWKTGPGLLSNHPVTRHWRRNKIKNNHLRRKIFLKKQFASEAVTKLEKKKKPQTVTRSLNNVSVQCVRDCFLVVPESFLRLFTHFYACTEKAHPTLVRLPFSST